MEQLKVLVVLDNNYLNERSDDEFRKLARTIQTVTAGSGMDAEVTEFAVDFDYDVSPEDLMKRVDSRSKQTCEDDYDCIIAEGLAAWFWLQARYEMPVVCINPALYPDEVYADHISQETCKAFWYVQDTRGLRQTYIACVTNDDELSDPGDDFGDERVFTTDVALTDEDFWTDDSELMRAVRLVLE